MTHTQIIQIQYNNLKLSIEVQYEKLIRDNVHAHTHTFLRIVGREIRRKFYTEYKLLLYDKLSSILQKIRMF